MANDACMSRMYSTVVHHVVVVMRLWRDVVHVKRLVQVCGHIHDLLCMGNNQCYDNNSNCTNFCV